MKTMVLMLLACLLMCGCKGDQAPFFFNNGPDQNAPAHKECPRVSDSCGPNSPPHKEL